MGIQYAVVALAFILLMVPVTHAHAVFWDLLIHAEVQNAPIPAGGHPDVQGRITDHGDDAVSGANVSIRTLGHTVWTVTDEDGRFAHTFNETAATPGLHSVVMHATADGIGGEKIGFADITYRTNGGSGLSAEEKILSTADAQKYLKANESDFENDLIGISLYKYYNDLYQKHMEKVTRQQKLDDEKNKITQNRESAQNATRQLVSDDEKRTGYISKHSYEKLISNADPSIKKDVIRQINYTVSAFKTAQEEMEKIRESGGSHDDAMEHYAKNNFFSKEVLNMILEGQSYENIVKLMQKNNTVTNTTLVPSNVTSALNMSSANMTDIGINQTSAENHTLPAPVYDMRIYATALDWDVPPSGTIINLTGSPLGLSSTGKIMVGINGTLVELQLHHLQISE